MNELSTPAAPRPSAGFEAGGAFDEHSPVAWVVLHHARDAYQSQSRLDEGWRAEGFIGRPELERALAQYERFARLLEATGARLDFAPSEPRAGLSAIYCRDSSIVTPRGVLLGNMKNECRRGEPAVMGEYFRALGLPIVGAIEGEGTLEGGDFIWLDERTCAVGHGYRTNAEGIRQLKHHLGVEVHVEVVGLPHYHGPGECLHLMSLVSPVAPDLAVVYSPLMPVPFREWLMARGMSFVEVPEAEFDPTMGCNVLALAPRQCLVIEGNAETRRRLGRAGCEVIPYDASEISIKGCGGPTCLTRPLLRRRST